MVVNTSDAVQQSLLSLRRSVSSSSFSDESSTFYPARSSAARLPLIEVIPPPVQPSQLNDTSYLSNQQQQFQIQDFPSRPSTSYNSPLETPILSPCPSPLLFGRRDLQRPSITIDSLSTSSIPIQPSVLPPTTTATFSVQNRLSYPNFLSPKNWGIRLRQSTFSFLKSKRNSASTSTPNQTSSTPNLHRNSSSANLPKNQYHTHTSTNPSSLSKPPKRKHLKFIRLILTLIPLFLIQWRYFFGKPHVPLTCNMLGFRCPIWPISGKVKPGYEAVREAFARNFEEGWEVGASFAAFVGDEMVVDLVGGFHDQQFSKLYTRDTLQTVFSSSKVVVRIYRT
jgi:hypothetical protein